MRWFWPASSVESTAMIRLGRVLHWVSYALSFPLLMFFLLVFVVEGRQSFTVDAIPATLALLAIAVAGRCARYVLANE